MRPPLGKPVISRAVKKIIVFIYDASSCAQEHATTIDALLVVEGIADVVITSRPSQLPPPGH
jgi:hypothetical protein